jgi:hypothetical protein
VELGREEKGRGGEGRGGEGRGGGMEQLDYFRGLSGSSTSLTELISGPSLQH